MKEDHKIIEHFVFDVTEANKSITKEFEINDSSCKITGLQLSSDREDLLHARGTFKLDFNGKELFSEGHEAKMLMASVHVEPNGRMFKIDEDAGNGKITIIYLDSAHALTTFTPYEIFLYVESYIESE